MEIDGIAAHAPLEPPAQEQRQKSLRELEEWGIDVSLIRTALARTPTERLRLLEDRLALIEEMQRGFQRLRGPIDATMEHP